MAFQPLGKHSWLASTPAVPPLRQRSMQWTSCAFATLVQSGRDQPWRLLVGLTVKLDVLMMITVVAFVSAIVLGAFGVRQSGESHNLINEHRDSIPVFVVYGRAI